MIAALRWWIAKTICPEMNSEAERWRYMSTEILHCVRWLGEFREVRLTLERLMSMTHDRFRPIGADALTRFGWARIEHFREDLRAGKDGDA